MTEEEKKKEHHHGHEHEHHHDADAAAGTANDVPNQVFMINSQFIKDLSFENVTPASRVTSDKAPEIEAQIKVDINKSDKKTGHHDVSLIFNIRTKVDNKTLFILDLNYEAEFTISGFPDDLMAPLLYIECPRMLFPFARSIIAHAVSEAGFPPIFLAPINFADLYQQQLEAQSKTKQ